MTPFGLGGSAVGPDPPPNLETLRDCSQRLTVLLEETELSPEILDAQANGVHKDLVMHAYQLMRTEVAQACGERWKIDDRQRFGAGYRDVAKKWPAYREAVAELERARRGRRSLVDVMVRLERPREDYISALENFHGELSATLEFFFPIGG